MKEPHKIIKQTLDVRVFENKDVYNLQSKVRDVYYEQLLPIIDAQFEAISPEGTTIKIDRLEIELGTVKAHSIHFNLKQELEKVISEYVYPIKADIELGKKKGQLEVKASEQKVNWSVVRTELHALAALKSFLKTGILPWGVNKTLKEQKSGLKGVVGLIAICTEKYPKELCTFLQENYAVRTVQQRVFHHFSEDQLLDLLVLVHGRQLKMNRKEIQALVAELSESSQSALKGSLSKRKSIWWHIFVALQQMPATSIKLGIVPAISWALKNEGIQPASLQHAFRKWSDTQTAMPVFRKLLESAGVPVAKLLTNLHWLETIESSLVQTKILESQVNALRSRKNMFLGNELLVSELNDFGLIFKQFIQEVEKETVLTTELMQQIKNEQVAVEEALKKVSEAKADSEENAEEELQKTLEEGIAVNNAGLVILASFLPFLFDHLGWLDEERKLLPEAHEKALAMTHFLVHDDEDIDESELTLNKVLLGIEIDEPIVNEYQLSETEKEEGINLLKVITQRWEALGSGTTPGGLQISFLQRSGLLYLRDDQYLLRVERKTLDILLDRVPWTIATVKLNWMDKLLLTEW